jgi:hypothetical protein
MSTQQLTLKSFEDQCLELTQEAFSARGSIRNLGEKLNAFSNSFKQFITQSFVEDVPNLGLLNENAFRKLSKADNYMRLRNKKVVVPKGLHVTYLEHLKSLHVSQKHIDGLFDDVLIPIEKFLGALLHNPDNLKGQREAGIVQDVIDRDVESVQKEVAKDFSRDQAEQRLYGELIGRQSDWMKISSSFNDLSESLAVITREEVLKYVTNIGELLETLIGRLEEDPEVYASNGVGISNMAKVAYAVASEVEYYALHSYMVEGLQVSIENATEIAQG